jgi:type IV secretion system protein VirB2
MNNYYPFTHRAKTFLPWLFILSFIAITLMWSMPAHASTSGSGLPWETPLNTFKDSITGPVAFIISILGIIGCGAALIWGGEIGDFVRKMIMVILAISILVFASKILTVLFSASGAVIPVKHVGNFWWPQWHDYLFKPFSSNFSGR